MTAVRNDRSGAALVDDHPVAVDRDQRRAADRDGFDDAAVAAACLELLERSTDPAEILGLLRALCHNPLSRRGIHPWADPERKRALLDQVVPAWQRYLRVRRPQFHHEVANFSGYRVGRRGTDRGIVRREPCFVSPRKTMQVFRWSQTLTVDDVWVYTADTAYHLGELTGPQPWSKFGGGPTLSGDHVVCRDVRPAGRDRGGRLFAYHCYAVLDSWPLTAEDVLGLVQFGHQRLGNHHDYSECNVTLLLETRKPRAVLQVGAPPRDEPPALPRPDGPSNCPPPPAASGEIPPS